MRALGDSDHKPMSSLTHGAGVLGPGAYCSTVLASTGLAPLRGMRLEPMVSVPELADEHLLATMLLAVDDTQRFLDGDDLTGRGV